MTGWIAVDLDGTLAEYYGWKGVEHIGKPIPLLVDRVKRWLAEGKDVRIFTARITCFEDPTKQLTDAREYIQAWCLEHIGKILPVVNVKDQHMIQLWDDRCVRVEINTGLIKGCDHGPKPIETKWPVRCPDCGVMK